MAKGFLLLGWLGLLDYIIVLFSFTILIVYKHKSVDKIVFLVSSSVDGKKKIFILVIYDIPR